jgi:small conductance mechanosensitive channel
MTDKAVAAEAAKQTVAEKISLTEQFLAKVKDFLSNQGVDILEAIIVFIIGYLICKEIKYLMKKFMARSKVDPSARSFIIEAVYFICLLFVAVTALGMAGISTTSLAAALGGIGLAIGLAMRDNFSNVASGLFILVFRPFNVGDYISVNGVEGTVTAILIMYTRVRTLGNQMIVLPNNSLTNNVIKNYSYYDTRNLEITVDVGYDTDLKQAMTLLQTIFDKSPYVVEKDRTTIYISEMADSSIRIYTRSAVRASYYYEARSAIFTEIKEVLDKAGIDIPFPQLVIHQAKD